MHEVIKAGPFDVIAMVEAHLGAGAPHRVPDSRSRQRFLRRYSRWVRWLRALVAPYDELEKVVLPGGIRGWASAMDDLMMIALPSAPPPYLVTVTAYGPEPRELQAQLTCRVVVKLVTLPPR